MNGNINEYSRNCVYMINVRSVFYSNIYWTIVSVYLDNNILVYKLINVFYFIV